MVDPKVVWLLGFLAVGVTVALAVQFWSGRKRLSELGWLALLAFLLVGATIQSGASSDVWTIDATSKAGRVTPYTTAGTAWLSSAGATAAAVPANASYVGGTDGTNLVGLVTASATNLTQSISGTNVLLGLPYATWNVNHVPGTAAKATASKAAGSGTQRHVMTFWTACESVAGTAQGPVQVQIRDGATGAGTILYSATVSAAATHVGTCVNSPPGFLVIGSQATAMTVEFSAAGAAATQQTVSGGGFTLP